VKVEEVADKIYWFKTTLPAVSIPFAVYLIRESEGVLIEPGPSVIIPSIQEAMEYLGMRNLDYIIPTHIHVDNGGGAGSLAQLFPHAKVVIHPHGAKHLVDPSKLIEGTKMVWGNNFASYLGPIAPVPESQLKITADGEIISVGDRELQILYAPGHAPHQIAIFDRSVGGLFCGEALGGATKHQMPAVAPPSFDLEVYVATIEKLRQLGARLLFYSHGGAWEKPERLISTAAEKARMYGDMILNALRQGQKPEDISRSIGDYIMDRFGARIAGMDLQTTVDGYAIYFKRKGLV